MTRQARELRITAVELAAKLHRLRSQRAGEFSPRAITGEVSAAIDILLGRVVDTERPLTVDPVLIHKLRVALLSINHELYMASKSV